VAIGVTFAGTLVPLNSEMANLFADRLGQIIADNNDFGSLAVAIFVNNCRICLVMFIPIFGAMFGLLALFSTGIAVNALAIVQGTSSGSVLLSLVLGPIFWIEFMAYSLGMAESVWLFRRLTQKRWQELKHLAKLMGVAVGLLAIGAVVESWMVLYLP
jgi:mannose/fructose/N-acetylgalactosamine-specific phosphotransferase system component IID